MDNNSSPHRGAASGRHGSTNTYIFAPIPSEILEHMIEYLDLSSISNLRLTCRDLANRAVGPHLLRTGCERTTIDLSSARFSRVEEIISSPVFGPAVKHLTVQAVVYYMDELDSQQISETFRTSEVQMNEVEEWLNWVADRRSEQALAEWDEHQEVIIRLSEMMGQLGGPMADRPILRSGLDLACIVSPIQGVMYSPARAGPAIWNNVARRASQAFYVTMNAMVRSGLKTPLLWIFPQTPRCSVPASTISWLLHSVDNQDLARVMSGIKNFALSFAPVLGTRVDFGLQPAPGASKEPNPERERQFDVPRLFLAADGLNLLMQEAFIAVPRFIAMVAADVEVLDLHMFTPYGSRTPEYCQTFVNLARVTHFPKLRDCTLRGLWATPDSVLQFLDKHGSQLRRLKLRDIWLPHGNWLSVFRKLQPDTLPNLQYLRLENLLQYRYDQVRNCLVNLSPKGLLQRKGIDRNGEEIYFNLTSLPDRCHFPHYGGKLVFLREWDGEAFFLESRDEHGVPVGLEFTDEPRMTVENSSMYQDWRMARADEFGPPPSATQWEEHHVSLGHLAI
ncbi:hypothetical protein V8F33_002433 [Rhypophila sp. PSN 637]